MAYDKIITIRSRLDRRISYALNKEKCGHLIAGINCDPKRAYSEMMQAVYGILCKYGIC